jgi:photosystem II stability/assembly factor-like uncharacterized protein
MKNFILLLTFLTSFTTRTSAQWQPTDGIFGINSQCALISGANNYLGTSNGVYLSTDNGNSWIHSSIGLPSGSSTNFVYALASKGNTIFAGTQNGVYQTTNNGNSWVAVNSGMSNIPVTTLAISGSNIFAGTRYGVYLSADDGSSWALSNDGLPVDSTTIASIVVKGSNIFLASSPKGVYVSTNNGRNWSEVNNGLPVSDSLNYEGFRSLGIIGEKIFLQTDKSVFLSTNNGRNWSNTNLPNSSDPFVASLVTNGTDVFVGTQRNIFVSADNGVSWTTKNQGTQGQIFKLLAANGATVITNAKNGDLFVSTNNGNLWAKKNSGLASSVNTVASDGGNVLLAGTGFVSGVGGMSNIFVSTNNAANWMPVTIAPDIFSMRCLAFSGSTALTIANLQLYSSSNSGSTWSVNSNLGPVRSLAISGSTFFAVDSYGILVSTNSGRSWTAANNGFDNWLIQRVVADGANAYAFGNLSENNIIVSNGIFLSKNNGSSWQRIMINSNAISAVAVKDTKIFVGTNGGGVSLSENNGNNWVEINNGLTNLNITALAVLGTNVFAGTKEGGVFVSNDNGTNWRAANEGLIDSYISSLNISGNYVCAGTKVGVFRRQINEFLTVGTKDNSKDFNCTISPNPVSNLLTINCSNELLGKKYAIHNILGEIILTNNLMENTTVVSLNNVPNSVYFLNIIGTPKTLKFVKQ